MNRIELLEELKKLEEKKQILLENVKALKSAYLNSCRISIKMDTSDFNEKGNSDDFAPDKKLLTLYLEKEISDTEAVIKEKLKQLIPND